MNLRFQFPPGVAMPALLDRLQQAMPAWFGDDEGVGQGIGDGFAFYAQPPADTALWFARDASPAALAAAHRLGVFGSAPDGSLFAVWHSPRGDFPVVCLGSEGTTQVLAADFAGFLQLLAIGYGSLENGGVYDTPPEDLPPEDERAESPLRDWLAGQGLSVPATGAQIVGDAAEAHPDFHGWCEDLGQNVEETAAPASAVRAADEAPAELWEHLVSAIGQPVRSPLVRSLLQRLGARPFAGMDPMSPDSWVAVPELGIEMRASCSIRHRRYWPPRRENRIYAAYVQRIRIDGSALPRPLPESQPWDRTTESSRSWTSPGRELAIEQDFEDGRLECTYLALPEERAYITVSPAYQAEKPLVYIEDAFFATWCGLNGLLAPAKFDQAALAPWQGRTQTPLAFLHGPCGGVLWSGDIAAEFASFISAYYLGFCESERQAWRSDIKYCFGTSNHFRKASEAMTPDSWKAYDRVAMRIALRLREWRAGKLRRAEW
jgi:hypothetical protein